MNVDEAGRLNPEHLEKWWKVTCTYLIALGCAGLPVASLAAEPLVLQGIMKDMGKNMQAIVDGQLREVHALVERAALAIAEHPQPPFVEHFHGKAEVLR
jgi:hypothetical protein